MPEMSGAKQCVERRIVAIGLDRRFQLLLHLRDRDVVIAVVDRPEPFDRGTADASTLIFLSRDGRRSAGAAGTVPHANENEESGSQQRYRQYRLSLNKYISRRENLTRPDLSFCMHCTSPLLTVTVHLARPAT